MSSLKTFVKTKYIVLGLPKKNVSSIRVVKHPSTSANISNIEQILQIWNVGWGAGVLHHSDWAEIFFGRSQHYILWRLKFQKSGEIILDLSQFWDTCWLITQGLSTGILRLHVAKCHMPEKVSQSYSTLTWNNFKNQNYFIWWSMRSSCIPS